MIVASAIGSGAVGGMILIEGAELMDPVPRESGSILVSGDRIASSAPPRKGPSAPKCDADILLPAEGSLDIVHMIPRGEFLVRDGEPTRDEAFLDDSNRKVELDGRKA